MSTTNPGTKGRPRSPKVSAPLYSILVHVVAPIRSRVYTSNRCRTDRGRLLRPEARDAVGWHEWEIPSYRSSSGGVASSHNTGRDAGDMLSRVSRGRRSGSGNPSAGAVFRGNLHVVPGASTWKGMAGWKQDGASLTEEMYRLLGEAKIWWGRRMLPLKKGTSELFQAHFLPP